MCIVCNPAFAEALRKLTFPSRRQILKSAAATTAGAFICEASARPHIAVAASAFPYGSDAPKAGIANVRSIPRRAAALISLHVPKKIQEIDRRKSSDGQ